MRLSGCQAERLKSRLLTLLILKVAIFIPAPQDRFSAAVRATLN